MSIRNGSEFVDPAGIIRGVSHDELQDLEGGFHLCRGANRAEGNRVRGSVSEVKGSEGRQQTAQQERLEGLPIDGVFNR